MKTRISLIVLTLLGFSFNSSELNQNFNISGVYENDILYLTCNQGCNWEVLEFLPQKKQTYINAYGASGAQFPEVHKAIASNFQFSVLKNDQGLQFKAVDGVNWLSVSAGCKNSCTFTLDNDGIRVSKKN
ncbi:MAG: hypothetical protein RQ756_08710 [Flavobacteriaceae bacterium]|nr:hypothetical protein [Flavobacteriaceae bacterium]